MAGLLALAVAALASGGNCSSPETVDEGRGYLRFQRPGDREVWLRFRSETVECRLQLHGAARAKPYTNRVRVLFDRRQRLEWKDLSGSAARTGIEAGSRMEQGAGSGSLVRVEGSERVEQGSQEARQLGQEGRGGVAGATVATTRTTGQDAGARVAGGEATEQVVAVGGSATRTTGQEARERVEAGGATAATTTGAAGAARTTGQAATEAVTTGTAREEVGAGAAATSRTTEQAGAAAVAETERREEITQQTRLRRFEEQEGYLTFIEQHKLYIEKKSEFLATVLRRDRVLADFFLLDRDTFFEKLDREVEVRKDVVDVRKWAVPSKSDGAPIDAMGEILSGETFRFVIEVKNIGDEPIQSLVLLDEFPNGLRYDRGTERGTVLDARGATTKTFRIGQEGADSGLIDFATVNKMQEGMIGWELKDGLQPGEAVRLSFDATRYLGDRAAAADADGKPTAQPLFDGPSGKQQGFVQAQDLILIAAEDGPWARVSVRRHGTGEREDGYMRLADTRPLGEGDAAAREADLQLQIQSHGRPRS